MSGSTFAGLCQRALVQHADRLPAIAVMRDWAALCRLEGHAAAAASLDRVAALREGFSPELRAARAGAPPEAWGDRSIAAPAGEGTVAIALAELEAFSRDWSAPLARRIAARPPATDASLPHRARAGTTVAPPPADVGAAVAALHAALAEDDGTAGADADTTLAVLDGAVRRLPGFDYRLLVGAPLPLLAEAVAFAGLQAFFADDRDLLFAPFGAAALARRTARFAQCGLGPGFGNVQRLARRSRDVFELAYRAHEAGDGLLPVEVWLALLARRLTGPLRDEVVDDLGDRDLRQALALVLDQAVAQPDDVADRSLIWRLRDIGLDNQDYALALRAQMRGLELTGGDLLNRVILGSIAGTAGQLTVAEQVFADCLAEDPENPDVVARIEALRAQRFEPFFVRRGYGSPADRQVYRVHQRGRKAVVERPAGPSLAVELNYGMTPRA